MLYKAVTATLIYLAVGIYGQHASLLKPTCSSILWTPCPEDAQFDCGSVQVPLDYAHPEVGNATLAVARLKSNNQPRLGTIFTNPGGPGGSGVEFLVSEAGTFINTVTRGHYDIVSWDPRGVNQSRPQISCGFTSQESMAQFFGDTIPFVGFEARGNFTDADDLNAFFSRVNETDAKIVQTGQRCLDTDGAFLKYMGTAAVVRDMVYLSECLESPEVKINYWGFSYGTVIGNYFVNMFPERVGRVIIDGVVDTVVWATKPSYELGPVSLSAVESVFQGFAEKCSEAGPQNCAIAQNDSTPASILQGIENLINTAYDLHKAGLTNITSFETRELIWGELYTPTTWDGVLVPGLLNTAAAFAALISNTSISTRAHTLNPVFGTLKPRQNTNTSNDGVDPNVQTFFAELVISCVDSIDQADVTTERVFQEVVSVTQKLAPTFGELPVTTGPAFCHRFPVRAVERFTGPFNHTLANIILVIGNKADPITPFANAKRIATMLGDSARLVEQNGFGHTSIAENSDCTQGVVREYFLYGALPTNGLVCETDQALFPPNSTLISPNPILPRGL
ncbi:alpha/beta-hydrolase [Ramaria rubella]|nr:alpha/beta-hydrolase [Ramaria rubella]